VFISALPSRHGNVVTPTRNRRTVWPMSTATTLRALARTLAALGNAGAVANAAQACRDRQQAEEATDAALQVIAARTPTPARRLLQPA
jgi:hypothetical protein